MMKILSHTRDEMTAFPAQKQNRRASPAQKNKFSFSTTAPRITLALTLMLTLLPPPVFAFATPESEIILCGDVKSAEMGSPVDQYALGRAYEKGYCGVSPDLKTAMAWYQRAARQNHMLADYRLAEIYFTGASSGDGGAVGTPDYVEAKKYYLAAATQGHGLSQLRLGFLYAEAHFKGLQTDYAEAEKWFLKAAEQDAGDARFRLGNFYHNYKNPPELEKAVHWLTLAAEEGHRVAMFDLARLLKKGEGVPADMQKSVMWMEKAAERGMLSAQMTLSEMYARGDGVEKDPVQSLKWTLKVAEAPTALPHWINKVADIYFSGWGPITPDYPRAKALYERAAAKGDAHALSRLGQIYAGGLGVAPDSDKARANLSRAASLGDAEAVAALSKTK